MHLSPLPTYQPLLLASASSSQLTGNASIVLGFIERAAAMESADELRPPMEQMLEALTVINELEDVATGQAILDELLVDDGIERAQSWFEGLKDGSTSLEDEQRESEVSTVNGRAAVEIHGVLPEEVLSIVDALADSEEAMEILKDGVTDEEALHPAYERYVVRAHQLRDTLNNPDLSQRVNVPHILRNALGIISNMENDVIAVLELDDNLNQGPIGFSELSAGTYWQIEAAQNIYGRLRFALLMSEDQEMEGPFADALGRALQIAERLQELIQPIADTSPSQSSPKHRILTEEEIADESEEMDVMLSEDWGDDADTETDIELSASDSGRFSLSDDVQASLAERRDALPEEPDESTSDPDLNVGAQMVTQIIRSLGLWLESHDITPVEPE